MILKDTIWLLLSTEELIINKPKEFLSYEQAYDAMIEALAKARGMTVKDMETADDCDADWCVDGDSAWCEIEKNRAWRVVKLAIPKVQEGLMRIPEEPPTSIVVLRRIRVDGLKTETWEDTFLYRGDKKAPEELKGLLRLTARALLTGARGDGCLSESCFDYNWGDFIMDIDDELLAGQGLELLHDGGKLVLVDPNVIVLPVNQDELLMETLPCTVILRNNNDGETISVPGTADMDFGEVEADVMRPGWPADQMTAAIDFGNGIEHACAVSEDRRDGICYHIWLD